MKLASRKLIAELQADRRLMARCPHDECGEEFALADAVLFSIHDDPPADARNAIKTRRTDIKARERDLIRRKTQKITTTEAVNIGLQIEKIIPSFPAFKHMPGDCRPLLKPVDYLVFSGLVQHGVVDKLVFVEIKTGTTRRLKDVQKQIKAAAERKTIRFETFER